jgi:hypothetical protein
MEVLQNKTLVNGCIAALGEDRNLLKQQPMTEAELNVLIMRADAHNVPEEKRREMVEEALQSYVRKRIAGTLGKGGLVVG